MYLRLDMLATSADRFFMAINPTVASLNDRITLLVRSDPVLNTMAFVIKQVDNVQYVSDLAMNYKGVWGYFCVIKNLDKFQYTSMERVIQSYTLPAAPWTMQMDGKVLLGGVSADHPTLATQVFRASHFLYIDEALTEAQIR